MAEAGAKVTFSVFQDCPKPIVQSLRDFEGDEYVELSMELLGLPCRYFAGSDKMRITDEVWTLEEFQRLHKGAYLQAFCSE